MDCLEFRRRLLVDPRAADTQAQAHRAGCAACAEAAESALRFEARLERALAVAPPAGMVDRILAAPRTDHARARRRGSRRTAWIALAVAASFVLAFGLLRWNAGRSVPDVVVAHVTAADEQEAWLRRGAVAPAAVDAAFADRGITLAAAPPRDVAYVATCTVGFWKSVHMVMPGNGQPVAAVFLPARHDRAADFRRDGMQGRVFPTGKGTMVLVAHGSERFDAIEREWRAAIDGAAVTGTRLPATTGAAAP